MSCTYSFCRFLGPGLARCFVMPLTWTRLLLVPGFSVVDPPFFFVSAFGTWSRATAPLGDVTTLPSAMVSVEGGESLMGIDVDDSEGVEALVDG